MRLHDILTETASFTALRTELRHLEQERDRLQRQWWSMKAPHRQEIEDMGFENWMRENGAFYDENVRPVIRRISEISQELRQAGWEQRLLYDRAGYTTHETLYHGTAERFWAFDRTKARTADHIYTSPDIETAQKYGPIIYKLYGMQEPQANLTNHSGDDRLLRKVLRAGGFVRDWGMTTKALIELVYSGEMYNLNKGRFQDALCDQCYAMGFRSVRISDLVPGGDGFSDSVIFNDPRDLRIIGRVDHDGRVVEDPAEDEDD